MFTKDKEKEKDSKSAGTPPIKEEMFSSEMPNAGNEEVALPVLGAPEVAKKEIAAPPEIPSSAYVTIGDLDEVKNFLTAQFQSQLQAAIDEMKSVVRTSDQGISAQMVGGQFNCPICGLRIIGPSLTAQVGKNMNLYEHPFDESPKLSGQKCELKGMKFRSPVLFLEFATPRPLTPATE